MYFKGITFPNQNYECTVHVCIYTVIYKVMNVRSRIPPLVMKQTKLSQNIDHMYIVKGNLNYYMVKILIGC